MATLKDVARKAGTSIATASYALNGREEVSNKTKKIVLEAAEELNYKPHGSARNLRRNTTKTIGLLLSSIAGPFYSELIRAVEEVVFGNGYNLVACSARGGRDSTALLYLQERHTDGILLLASEIDDETIVRNSAPSYPIVLLDRELEAPYVSSVTVDNEAGAFRMTQYLIDRGYREISYVSGPLNSLDARHRLRGYQKALQANGIEFSPEWLLQGYFTQDGGYYAAKSLTTRAHLPKTLFCANDEMAVGVIKAFQEEGIAVPTQVGVVGFDDITVAGYLSPSLTTMRQPLYEMGTIAAHMAFDLLAGTASHQNVKLETELVERESALDGMHVGNIEVRRTSTEK